ncbi:M56 family metallopeptidase [Marinimicrobium agarilyticum]|uniref:M56 family metallopeptidase n=1 Tax=Marinimicrobium agarilyticum TaxID=306546 RepID=UPI00040C3262|nr:M56 family metallopeptidase [Marinimicrobium agarilyticum]
MNWLTQWLGEAFVFALGWTLLHSLWQGALVAAGLALLLAARPRWSSNARYLSAVVALAVVLIMSALTYSRYYLMVELALAESATVPEPVLTDSGSLFSPAVWAGWINRHMSTIVLLWMLGFALFMARYCGGLLYCHRLKNQLSEPAPSYWQARVDGLARSIGVRGAVVLKLSRRLAGPCVVGHLKPVILLPVALLTQMSRDELEAIVQHELAHIRRNDYLVGLIQSLIKTLYFFNWPVLWISAQIDRERENACDDIAADGCKSRIFYAETLARFSALTMDPSASNDGGLIMAVNGKHHHLLARIQRLFEPTVSTARPFEGLLSSVLLVVLGLFLSVHSQAEDQYPDIKTLDDASVESLIDTFRSQLMDSEDENHFVTTLVPTADYQALSEEEREAFIRHFKASLWERHSRDKKPMPFYDHLNEEEWLEARRVMFQEDFDHFIRALKGELKVLEAQEARLPGESQPIRFTHFEGGRMESEIPVSAVRFLLAEPSQAVKAGPFLLRALKDSSLLLTLKLGEQVSELATARRITSDDFSGNGALAGEMQHFAFNGDPEMGQVWSFAATDDFYQMWLSQQAVNSLLKGENSKGFSALSGYRVSREGMLEVAFDPKPEQYLNSRLMNFMESKKMPHVEERDRELEDLLSKLPSDLHQYLYQEEHLKRHFKAWSLKTGVEMSDRMERLYRTVFQKARVEFLLDAVRDSERDALEMAHRSISVWANEVSWVNIYPLHKDDPEKLFDLIVEDQTVTEAVAQVAEVCEGIELPEGHEVVTQPVSLYGYETHCEQWPGVFDQLVENHSDLVAR